MISTRRHIRAIALLGIPIIVGQLGTVMQGFADTMMVGNYGTPELSAAGFVNNVYNLIFFFLLGISYATTPVTGSAFGRGDMEGVERSRRESLVVNLMVSLVVVAMMGLLYFRLEWLQQPEELMPLIRPYYLTLLFSMPCCAVFNAMKQHLDAMGMTRISMLILVASNVINIVLNALLIFGLCGCPQLGLTGAGLATLTSRFLMALATLYVARRVARRQRPNAPRVKVSFDGCKHLIAIGLPVSIQLFLETASFSICAIMMGWLGSVPLAAHQVTTTISTIIFTILYGMAGAAAIRISQFRGRGEHGEIRRIALVAWGMNATYAALLICIIWLSGSHLIGLFTSSPEVTAMVLSLYPLLALYQLGDCTQITFANALRGIECVRRMMLYSVVSYAIIALPTSYLLAFHAGMGPQGIWLGIPCGLTTAGILFLIDFYKNTHKA